MGSHGLVGNSHDWLNLTSARTQLLLSSSCFKFSPLGSQKKGQQRCAYDISKTNHLALSTVAYIDGARILYTAASSEINTTFDCRDGFVSFRRLD